MAHYSSPNVVNFISDVITTKQVRDWIPNPTGKGGFAEHPEHISPGGFKKEATYGYWLSYFKNLPLDEFVTYPKKSMNMAAAAAYQRVKKSVENLQEFKEVADRTEGKPIQPTEVSGPNRGDLSVRWNDGSNYTLHTPSASATTSQLQGQVLSSSYGQTDREDNSSSQRTDQEGDTVPRE